MTARHSYEEEYPWEQQIGTTIDRTIKRSQEASQLYRQQQTLLPTIEHHHELDPVQTQHLLEFGRRVHIIHQHGKKHDKKALQIASKEQAQKRLIPTQYDSEHVDEETIEKHVEVMLMDQEWDTRSWNGAKLRAAIDTLYEEIESSPLEHRRRVATTMLIRLLETREEAVDYVETTLPILINKAFRQISKHVEQEKHFRICALLSILAEWFQPLLSRDNATNKCITFLLRESDVCARIVQHHWRGILFERHHTGRVIDPSVRARLRSMHLIKHVELRHQFKVWRETVGPMGLGLDVIYSYVTLLFHAVQPKTFLIQSDVHDSILHDQHQVMSSGILVYLSSLMTKEEGSRRLLKERIKAIALALVRAFQAEADKIVVTMKSNIIHRVLMDVDPDMSENHLDSSLEVVLAIAQVVSYHFQRSNLPSLNREDAFLVKQVEVTAHEFLTTPSVIQTLLRMLPIRRTSTISIKVLTILKHIGTTYGLKPLLEAFTSYGGRSIEHLLMYWFEDDTSPVLPIAVSFFYEMTLHPDVRAGFTTAGALQILSPYCTIGIEDSKSPMKCVLALIGLTLLARQETREEDTTLGTVLSSLDSLSNRIEVWYSLLLDLVMKTPQQAAMYLYQHNLLVPIFLPCLVQVQPSEMEPRYQTKRQRHKSCIVLSRFIQIPVVAHACFSDLTIHHLILSLQSNRLEQDDLYKSSTQDRWLHYMATKEICKALSRLARCTAKIEPCQDIPQLPQAKICDSMIRFHVLEDVLPLIHVPSNGSNEFPDIERAIVYAAIELIGYLRPMPYGEAIRERFLAAIGGTSITSIHAQYAHDKLSLLVQVVAPSMLHVLREKNIDKELVDTCCISLARLASTNASRGLLLQQGCVSVILLHFPLVLCDASNGMVNTVMEENKLLDVPASFFTLLGKLAVVTEGRAAIMRAQILPRILKRLQLTDPNKSIDQDVKSEIAVVIEHMAMMNTIEGNSSELFLHFHVVELLMTIIQHLSIEKKKKEKNTWRMLNHGIGALAALSQDVFVTVPKLVALNVVPQLARFLRYPLEMSPHVESLRYHVMTIIRAIASYPFGEYHSYLLHTSIQVEHLKIGLMEQVKTLANDFTLELQHRSKPLDRKTVGELARETLAFINELIQKKEHRGQSTGSMQSVRLSQEFLFPPLSPTKEVSVSSPSKGILTSASMSSLPRPKTPILPPPTASTPSPLGGIDLMLTRPSGDQPRAVADPHYIFARPKPTPIKHKKKRPIKNNDGDGDTYGLMLDPLFQPVLSGSNGRTNKAQSSKRV